VTRSVIFERRRHRRRAGRRDSNARTHARTRPTLPPYRYRTTTDPPARSSSSLTGATAIRSRPPPPPPPPDFRCVRKVCVYSTRSDESVTRISRAKLQIYCDARLRVRRAPHDDNNNMRNIIP